MLPNVWRWNSVGIHAEITAHLCRDGSYMWSKNNFSKVKWRFWGCKMITATGNRTPPLKTASHNTVSKSVASLTFFFPSALSHTINFTSLSIPKSSSFHAKAQLVTSFFCMLSFLSIERQLSSLNTEYKLRFTQLWDSRNLCIRLKSNAKKQVMMWQRWA